MQQQKTFEVHCEKQNHNLERIWQELGGMREDFQGELKGVRIELTRRLPLWATFLITGLFSAVAGFVARSWR